MRKVQHPIKISMQLQGALFAAAAVPNSHNNLLNHRANGFARASGVLALQMGRQVSNRFAVKLLIIGGKAHDRLFGEVGKFVFQPLSLPFQFLKASGEAARSIIVFLNPLEDLGAPVLGITQCCGQFITATMRGTVMGIKLLLEMACKAGDNFRRQQAVLQSAQRALLQLCARDRGIVASAPLAAFTAPTATGAYKVCPPQRCGERH
jgi:hypothetical protein